MQRQQLTSRRRAELVPQEAPELVVGDERLGDVAAPAQDVEQRHARRLAEGRGLDRPAGGLLGVRELAVAEPGPGQRDGLQQLDALVVELRPERRQPAGLETGEQIALGDRQGRRRGLPARARIARPVCGAALAQPVPHRLPVDPRVLREAHGQLPAALEPAGPQRAPQPGQRRTQEGVAAGRRPVVRPERLHQLVAAHEAVAMQCQEREQQPALASGQRVLEALAVPLDLQPPAQVDPGLHRRILGAAPSCGQAPRAATRRAGERERGGPSRRCRLGITAAGSRCSPGPPNTVNGPTPAGIDLSPWCDGRGGRARRC